MGILQNLKSLFGGGDKQSQQNPEANTGSAKQKKLLIVEDEEILSKALELKFTGAGFLVIKAVNGEQGLALVQSEKPDIILLDLLMPVMDGKTMLRRLREIPEFKTLPVVVLTNAGEIDNMREVTTYDNASEFLIKSNVSIDEILTKVNDLT